MPNRPTLSTFRAQFPAEAMGVCLNDPQVAVYANDACERLMLDPLCPDEGWNSGWATMAFTVSISNGSAFVVAPREVERIIGISVCQRPIPMRNNFFEWLAFGRGLQPKACQNSSCGSLLSAYERGNAVTFAPLLATPQFVRVYPTDIRDTSLRVLIQGKDQNKMIVLTTDPGTGLSAPGEYLPLAFPFSTTVNTFSTIDGLMKDQTFGPLQFFQTDPVTGAELPLSSMEPNESAASYRRYFVNGIPSQNLCCTSPGNPLQITAQARLCFMPVQNETDYLSISCVPAIVEEAMSIRFSRMENGAAQSAFHHGRAIALLNGELDAVLGKTNVAVNVPIWGSAKLRKQPV